MKKCAYYTCDEFVPNDEDGFVFCYVHVAFLDKMTEIDQDNGNILALLTYCFSALNNKNRDISIQ